MKRPALVAAAACVATLVVLGGSLAVGLVFREPQQDVGGGWIQLTVPTTNSENSLAWWVIGAAVLGIAASALILRSHLINARKEPEMAATLDKSPMIEQVTGTPRRRDRRLLLIILVLAAAVIALGALVAFDLASSSETAANDEVTELFDDYMTSWVGTDTTRYLELTGPGYTFSSLGQVSTAEEQAAPLAGAGGFTAVETIGDLVVTTNSGQYMVAAAQRISHGGRDYVGVSALRMVNRGSGLQVVEHTWIGDI